MRFGDRAHRQGVGRADDGGDGWARRQQLMQAVASLGERMDGRHHAVGAQRYAGLRKRAHDAAIPSARAIVGGRHIRDHAKLPMPQPKQVARELEGRRRVVDADGRHALARRAHVSRDEWDLMLANELQNLVGEGVADQRQSVDAAFEQCANLAQFLALIVLRVGDEQGVAVLAQPILKRLDAFGEDRDAERRHDGADRPHPADLERACGDIRHVGQFRHGAIDLLAQFQADDFRPIEHTGSRGHRNPCDARNVLEFYPAAEGYHEGAPSAADPASAAH